MHRIARILALALSLCAAVDARAQDMPDLTALPVLTGPGALTAASLPDQAAWITVTEPGLYSLALDGPGGLALTHYATEDGRSDGSTAATRVAEDGAMARPGILPHLFLLPGQHDLVQIVGLQPMGLQLSQEIRLDLAAAQKGEGIAPGPVPLAPQDLFLVPEGSRRLALVPTVPMRVALVAPPGLKVEGRLAGQAIGPDGVFPLAAGVPVTLDLTAPPGVPVLIRATPAPEGLDEIEPGPTALGAWRPGRPIRGVLLAPDDRDQFGFDLTSAGVYDLTVTLDAPRQAHLRLMRQTSAGWSDLIGGEIDGRGLAREGLTLPAGSYQVELAGSGAAPVGYQLDLFPAADPAAAASSGGEPDDTPETARTIMPGQGLHGVLGPDNPAFLRFAIPAADHLWELRGAFGLETLTLTGPSGIGLGQWAARDGGLALRLALPPGPYLARLTGTEAYALRLTDLGPLPPGREAEPDDDTATAMLLAPGQTVDGDFQSDGDADLFEVLLGAPTPLRLTIAPADDGAIAVGFAPAAAEETAAVLAPGAAPLVLDATFPAGRSLVTLRPREAGMSGHYRIGLQRIDSAEPDEPSGTAILPLDGQIAGNLGGLDPRDRIALPVPDTPGAAIILCSGAFRFWTLQDLTGTEPLARGEPGVPQAVQWTDAAGGRLLMQLEAADDAGAYACRVAQPPDEAPPAPAAAPAEGTGLTLAPGRAVQGRLVSSAPEVDLQLGLEPGALSVLRCDLPPGSILAEDAGLATALAGPPLPDGGLPVVGTAEPPILHVSPDPARALPQDFRCDLADPDRLTGGVAGAAADPAGARSPVQVQNDLPVALRVEGLETPLRAYARAGQVVAATLTVASTGAEGPVALQVEALGDGWRVEPATASVDLAAGPGLRLPLRLTLPPMQSPLMAPAIRIVARAGARQTAIVVPVALDPAAPERGTQAVWSVPEGLRGGLSPMRHALGGRLVALDDQPVDAATAEAWSFLHDDDALDAQLPALLAAGSATFQLGEAAPIRGLFLRLRSDAEPRFWPDRIAVDLSDDGLHWTQAAEVSPAATLQTQAFALERPQRAGWVRIRRFGCLGDPACGGIALADVGVIADPAWRPSESPNLLDPALGGHVMAGLALGGRAVDEHPFGGDWNDDLLTAETSRALLPASAERGDRVEAILAFGRNRAARLTAVSAEYPVDYGERAGAAATVEVSLAGPAGPWTAIGRLTPPAGAGPARLDLLQPLWVRALRLTFARDPAADLILPDRIRATEDPGAPSILGLWEDDRPDAGLEALTPTPPAAMDAAGGPDRAAARPLVPDAEVVSAVAIERNEDWWRLTVPDGPPRRLHLTFAGAARPDFRVQLFTAAGGETALARRVTEAGDLVLSALVPAGQLDLRISEPPRSVAILWDTSGSVEEYLPAILSAVPRWALSLKPGRERLQLLPFGVDRFLLPDFAETPEAVAPALAQIGPEESSDSESALGLASEALADQDGMRGIVIITDAETRQADRVWGPMLAAHPRIVALSIGSSDPAGVRIMRDWAALDGGLFFRVDGHSGMTDAMKMAAAIFQAPKAYRMRATLDPLAPEDAQATLTLTLAQTADSGGPQAGSGAGAVELILDASGSMRQRLPDGTTRIDAARQALVGLIDAGLPEGMLFAFRRFGMAKGSCESRLEIGLGPLDPGLARPLVASVPAINLARTAIAASLKAAGEDLKDIAGPRQVVLMTDGEETCGGDVPGTLAQLKAEGIDLRLTIIGFAVDDQTLASTFADWAGATGGQYLPAEDAAALAGALTRATAPRILAQALDPQGQPVGSPVPLDFDTPVTLAAGTWRLTPSQSAAGAALDVVLVPGGQADVTYRPDSGLTLQPGKE